METSPLHDLRHVSYNQPISDKLIYEVDPKFEPEMINAMLASVLKEHPHPAKVNGVNGEEVHPEIGNPRLVFFVGTIG